MLLVGELLLGLPLGTINTIARAIYLSNAEPTADMCSRLCDRGRSARSQALRTHVSAISRIIGAKQR